LLTEIGRAVRQASEQPLRLEGHTDDLPIRNEQFPSNWELSAARAIAVLRVLVEDAGISPTRICVAGYAEFRPLAPNASADGRSSNRRVDIVILSSSAAAMAPRQKLETASPPDDVGDGPPGPRPAGLDPLTPAPFP
jgi:chemotaxis protein MotB